MKFRQPRQFAETSSEMFRGRPRVIPGVIEGGRMYGKRKGDRVSVEMYATAPVGTVVWIRHEICYSSSHRDTGRAGFQCMARVTKSERIRLGSRFRTTFVLIAEPECSDY